MREILKKLDSKRRRAVEGGGKVDKKVNTKKENLPQVKE